MVLNFKLAATLVRSSSRRLQWCVDDSKTVCVNLDLSMYPDGVVVKGG